MKIKTLLFAISAAALCSCSTTYKSGQTPDDVYYSPARPVAENVKVEKEEDEKIVRKGYMDREIVMGIYDPRWRYFADDYHAYYDPYRYGYNYGYYYNPYYYPCPVYISGAAFSNPKNQVPRMANLGSYNYSNMVVVNGKNGATRTVRSTRVYNNSNTENYIRRVITPEANTNSRYSPSRRSDNNSRSYSPSPSNNNGSRSSGGSSGGSGTPVTRPSRGG